MNFDILGWVSGLFVLGFGFSQLKHLFKVKSTKGLSLSLWQLYFGVQTGWVAYGYLINKVALLWPSVACALIAAIVIVYYYVFQSEPVKSAIQIFGLSLFYGLIFGLVAKVFEPNIIGLIFVIPAAIGQISQLLEIEFSSNLRGVSVTMLLLYVFNQSVNLIWGILIDNAVLKITAISAMAILTASIVVYYYRLRRFLSKKSR